MSDKLQEIKQLTEKSKWLGFIKISLDVENVEWLISQLEQAQAEIQQLNYREMVTNKANETLGRYVREGKAEIEQLRASNQKLVEALGDIQSQKYSCYLDGDHMANTLKKMARQALSQYTNTSIKFEDKEG